MAILVLFLYAKVLGEAFHHFGFPSLVGEVLTGIVLGPAVLGWVAPDAYLEGIAMLGLVVLMLVSGMNSRFDLLSKLKFKSAMISIPAAGLSFLFAFAIPYTMGFSFTTSLFIGAALTNTSTDVLARVVERHRLGSVLMGAALIDDIIAVYIIGIISAMVINQSIGVLGLLRVTVLIVVFFIGIAYSSRELMVKRNIIKPLWRLEERGGPIAFALSLALALAVLAHWVGLHMIIGAYMAGLFISRLRERRTPTLVSRIQLNKILDEVSVSLESVLTPIFFAYVGLQLAPEWNHLNPLLIMGLIAAAFGGKFVGGSFGGWVSGYRKEAHAIGAAMCSRGALELALLHFGLRAEIIPSDVFSSMVLLVILTALLSPVLFKYAAE